MTIDGEDFGVSAEVGEAVVVGAGVDFAAEAADELHLGVVLHWRRERERGRESLLVLRVIGKRFGFTLIRYVI